MLSSIKLYLFPLKLSFGMLEMLHFWTFWRCGISLPAMRTIFINDAHYLWQWSALSLKVVFCRVGANMLPLVFTLSSELNIKAAILIRRMAAFIILWRLVCLWLLCQVELQNERTLQWCLQGAMVNYISDAFQMGFLFLERDASASTSLFLLLSMMVPLVESVRICPSEIISICLDCGTIYFFIIVLLFIYEPKGGR